MARRVVASGVSVTEENRQRALRLRRRLAADPDLRRRVEQYLADNPRTPARCKREIDALEWAEYWSRPRVSTLGVHTSFGAFSIPAGPRCPTTPP